MKKNPTKTTPGSTGFRVSPFAWVITGFAVIIVGILIINRMHEPDPVAIPAQQQGAEASTTGGMGAAPEFSLKDIAGETKSLESYKGKVVMLNFWATWCGPCKREIPDFIELQEAYRDKGFEIVGISLDEPGKEEEVRSFVDEQGINYDILFGDSGVATAYGGVRSIPTTFIIDREGNIVDTKMGLQPKDVWRQAIEAAL